MNWVKNNPYISLLVGVIFSCTLCFTMIAGNHEQSSSEINIKEGDTLWTLSIKYGGDTPNLDWITEVMVVNNLETQQINAGDSIIIPNTLNKFSPDKGIELAGESK